MRLPPPLQGIIAATVLPLKEDGQLDLPALGPYLEWLLGQGVHGLAINVDTGEGPHLSPREALQVLEHAAAVVGGRVPVIAGLGPQHTEATIATARDLRQAGADALLVFPSSTFRGQPLPPELPCDYYRSIGEGAEVPLVLFQLQEALGGVEYSQEVLVALAQLDCVIAIKEATFDALRFRQTVTALRESWADITILTGNDNFLLESFLLGADGALVGFGTVATRQQVEMVEAYRSGDLDQARELGARVQALADVIFAPPVRDYRVRLKEALTMLEVIPRATIRRPLQPLKDPERVRIREALDAAGLL